MSPRYLILHESDTVTHFIGVMRVIRVHSSVYNMALFVAAARTEDQRMETFRPSRVAHPRCLRETDFASAGEGREVATTFGTWSQRAVRFIRSFRQADTASEALGSAGATRGRFSQSL